jgi:HAD superfamily hydrolase (TIGR01549 family)
MKNGLKAIVFDWDQTLYETFPLHRAGIEHAARECGRGVPSVGAIINGYAATIEEHIQTVLGLPLEEPLASYLRFYYQRNLEMCKPFPRAAETLGGLKEKGYRLAVLSNKEGRAGYQEVAASGLAQLFDGVAFREQVPELKPRPGGLLWMLKTLGVSPIQAIYIGDEPRDIQCARLAGVRSGAALWGTLRPQELQAMGPDSTWERLEALAQAF